MSNVFFHNSIVNFADFDVEKRSIDLQQSTPVLFVTGAAFFHRLIKEGVLDSKWEVAAADRAFHIRKIRDEDWDKANMMKILKAVIDSTGRFIYETIGNHIHPFFFLAMSPANQCDYLDLVMEHAHNFKGLCINFEEEHESMLNICNWFPCFNELEDDMDVAFKWVDAVRAPRQIVSKDAAEKDKLYDTVCYYNPKYMLEAHCYNRLKGVELIYDWLDNEFTVDYDMKRICNYLRELYPERHDLINDLYSDWYFNKEAIPPCHNDKYYDDSETDYESECDCDDEAMIDCRHSERMMNK